MQNEIRTFTHEQFGQVRTVVLDGNPWFVGKDVADALGYSNPRDALSRHVEVEDKNTVAFHDGTSGNPNQTVINESGLYCLIISSKLPTAKQFKLWITREVLPAIRKHGAYFTDRKLVQLLSDPTQAHLLVMEYAHEALDNERLKMQLEEALPKALYYDQFVNPQECTNIRITAKELGIPEKQFTSYLQRHH